MEQTPHDIRQQHAQEYIAQHGVDVSPLQPDEIVELHTYGSYTEDSNECVEIRGVSLYNRLENTFKHLPYADLGQAVATLDAIIDDTRYEHGSTLLKSVVRVAPEAGLPRWHRLLASESRLTRNEFLDELSSTVGEAVPEGTEYEYPTLLEAQELADEAALRAKTGLTKQNVKDLVETYAWAVHDQEHSHNRIFDVARSALSKVLRHEVGEA